MKGMYDMSNTYMDHLTQEDKNKLILEKERELQLSKTELHSLFKSNHTTNNSKLSFITNNTKIIDEKNVLDSKSNIEKINSAYFKQKDNIKSKLNDIILTSDLGVKDFPYLNMVKIEEKKDHIAVSLWFNAEKDQSQGVISKYQVYIVNMYLYDNDKVKYDYSLN